MNAYVAGIKADALSALKPDCTDPAERELRERLMVAREIATANLSAHEGDAQHLNLMIATTAQRWIFAPASIKQLELALQHCRKLMSAFASGELLNGRVG
jgi:hypothetical protein